MTPEQELIEAVLAEAAPQTPHWKLEAILTTASVQAALAKVRAEGTALHAQAAPGAAIARMTAAANPMTTGESFTVTVPATPKPEPVLRWEGDDLWLAAVKVASVWQGNGRWAFWETEFGPELYTEDTLTEARTAAEQAVRDWLKRAGVV